MKKTIAIVGWSTGENSFGVTKPYLEYFSQFGQVKILTPQEGMEKDIDLLVLPGGADLSSIEYGQVPGFMNSNPDLFKEYFYRQNLKQYIEAGVSIFAICLGLQQLNVYFGGKLVQNIWWNHGYSNPRTELVHMVYKVTGFDEDSGQWLYKETKEKDKDALWVNSMHHQGVDLQGLAEDLKPLLLSPDGFVEAFEHKTLPISAIQFHSEELMQSPANAMIRKLLTKTNQVVLNED